MTSPETGGEVVVDALLASDVTTVFGIPGGHLLGLYDALLSRPGLNHVLTRHEQAAGFAAIGYSRIARRPGVCIGTTGPGFTNLITPLGEAYVGFDPVVALAGQVPTARSRPYRGDLHEIPDQRALASGLVRWSAVPSTVAGIAPVVAGAVHAVTTGVPGPAYVELAADLLAGPVDPDARPQSAGRAADGRTRVGTVETALDPNAIEVVARTLAGAARPLIVAGRGVSRGGAWSELRRLAGVLQAPVLLTPAAAGVVAADDPLFAGVLCPFDQDQATVRLVREADVTIVVGSRLGAITTGHWEVRFNGLVQIDADAESIGWNQPVIHGIVGRADQALDAVASALDGHTPADSPGWGVGRAGRSRIEHEAGIAADRDPERSFVADLRSSVPRDVPVVIDSMMFNLWLGWYWDTFEPGTLLLSSRFDAMGAAIPIAMGAAVARSGPVVAICGDGGFGISGMELATFVKYGLDVTILVINDGRLGSVADGQMARYGRLSQADLTNPDIVAVARAFGVDAVAADGLADVGRLVASAIRRPGPSLIEVKAEIRSPW